MRKTTPVPPTQPKVQSPVLPINQYKIDVLFADSSYPKAFGIHTGLDFNGVGGGNTDLNLPFMAIADGTVVYAEDVAPGAWGGLIVVHHPHLNIWSRYGHHVPRSRKVSVGQKVSAGTVLAGFGRGAGGAYFAHLHFDIMKEIPVVAGKQRWWNWPQYNVDELERFYLSPITVFQKFNVSLPRITSPGRTQTFTELRRKYG